MKVRNTNASFKGMLFSGNAVPKSTLREFVPFSWAFSGFSKRPGKI